MLRWEFPTAMPIDAYRRGDDLVVHVDLPGIDPASIDITAEKHGLTISAERRFQAQDGDKVLVSERPRGRFSRRISLGEAFDLDHAVASYDAGVLTLRVPVAEAAKPRRIEVTNGHGDTVPQALDATSTAA